MAPFFQPDAKVLKSMEIVVYSIKSVSTKVSKEIVPFQQEFAI